MPDIEPPVLSGSQIEPQENDPKKSGPKLPEIDGQTTSQNQTSPTQQSEDSGTPSQQSSSGTNRVFNKEA